MSARTVVNYDGTSLQTANILVDTIQHESISHKTLDIQTLGRADGGKIAAITYTPKVVVLTGTIKGSSQSDLESRIESLKELINRQQRNLDIGYAGGTRRYITTLSQFTMQRMHFNLSYAEWEAQFVVSNPPFARGLDTSTFSFNNITTTGTYSGTATFIGNARPLPIIKVTVNAQTAMTALYFRNKNTGDSITIRRTFANNDIVIIDTRPEGFTATVNGVAVDYEGFFPEFAVQANDFAIKAIASAVNMTAKLIAYPVYI